VLKGTKTRKEAINIEFTSNLPLVNDQCLPITNGLNCTYNVMNNSNILNISVTPDEIGSAKIEAKITTLPQNVNDTNLNNQETKIWLTTVENQTPMLETKADIEFEDVIQTITSVKESNTLAIGFSDQANQLITTNSKGEYALITKFADNHNTHNIDLIDLNNDQRLDVIATSKTQEAQVFINNTNELSYSQSFSKLPITNVQQTAVINDGVYAIADEATLYILQSNMSDQLVEHSKIDIANIKQIQVEDINKDQINDLLITTSNHQFLVFTGSNSAGNLFDNSGIKFTLSPTTTTHTANFDGTPMILQGDENGVNILKVQNNTLTQTDSISLGQIKDIDAINDKGVFYALNDSGSIFVYQYKEESASLVSTMHTSFASKIVHLPVDSKEFSLLTAHNKTLSMYNVEIPDAHSVITTTNTDTQTTTSTQTSTNTDTSTQTSTQIDTATDTDEDISTLVSNTADNPEKNNVKIGNTTMLWVIMLFGCILLLRIKLLSSKLRPLRINTRTRK